MSTSRVFIIERPARGSVVRILERREYDGTFDVLCEFSGTGCLSEAQRVIKMLSEGTS